jgi:PleD family two-component response regulator
MSVPAFTNQSELMSETDGPTRPPLILIANDQEWSARSLATILEPRGYAVLRVYNGRQTLDMARSVQPDAIILDVRLPDLSGFDVCRQLYAERHVVAGTPVLLTTSDPINRTQQLAGLKVGAWDFMSQPLDGEVLLLKLSTYVRSKREADALRADGLLDASTGLYSSRGLVRRAREIGAEALRRGDALACLAFTPEPPHEEVTVRIAEHLGGILSRTARVSDATGRLGQAEFAIVAPSTGSAGAVRLAERVRDAVAATPLESRADGEVVHVRAGYCAVQDFSASAVDALEMLVRAASALRHGPAEGPIAEIRSFDDADRPTA